MSSREIVDVLDAGMEVGTRPFAFPPPADNFRFLANSGVKRAVRVVLDVVALGAAYLLAVEAVMHWLRVPPQALNVVHYPAFFVPLFAAGLLVLEGNASNDMQRPERELEFSVKHITLLFLVLGAANSFVFRGESFSRYLIVSWYVVSVFAVLAMRFGVRLMYAMLWRRGLAQTRVVLIGVPDRFNRYRELLLVQRHHAERVLGVVTAPGQGATDDSQVPILGTSADWERAVRRARPDIVVLDPPSSDHAHRFVIQVMDRCRELRIPVELFSDVLMQQNATLDFNHFTGSVRVHPKPEWSILLGRTIKSFIDLAAGLVGSIFTLLITPVIAIAINLEDRGPIFHRREFVACDGQVRYYLKFRTMVQDADLILQNDPQLKARFQGNYKLHDDPRVLKVGRLLRKYSIDEFPQFFSLLRGDLTLVGPRVISREEADRYGDCLPKRLTVKPGITGYWQTMGRQTTSYDERVKMDMFYIDHWSIWMDIIIIVKTFLKLLRPEGAF